MTTELQERFLEITHIITCLYRFSITIQNPTSRDRLLKCASIDVSYYEFFDIQHVSHKFPKAEKYLVDRLGKANSRRRQLLKYHEKHHNKLVRYIGHSLAWPRSALQPNQHEAANEGSELLARTDGDQSAQDLHSHHRKGPSTIATTMNTGTTIATYVEGPSDTIDVDSDTYRSQTSYATSISGDAGRKIRIPPPRSDSSFDGKPFECPYCFSITIVRGSQAWM